MPLGILRVDVEDQNVRIDALRRVFAEPDVPAEVGTCTSPVTISIGRAPGVRSIQALKVSFSRMGMR
jgi:hypothetical protein